MFSFFKWRRLKLREVKPFIHVTSVASPNCVLDWGWSPQNRDAEDRASGFRHPLSFRDEREKLTAPEEGSTGLW